jgi:hypothetical protein
LTPAQSTAWAALAGEHFTGKVFFRDRMMDHPPDHPGDTGPRGKGPGDGPGDNGPGFGHQPPPRRGDGPGSMEPPD